MSGIEMNVQGR